MRFDWFTLSTVAEVANTEPLKGWSIFGVSSDAIVAGTVGVLFGSLVASALSLGVDWLKSRRESTFALHKEFYEMMDLRVAIDKRLPSFARAGSEPDQEFMNMIWRVMAFYERLFFYYKRHAISRRLVCDLFGENLHWWYEAVFASHLNRYPYSQTSRDCLALHSAVWRRASSKQREEWNRHAATGPTIDRGNFQLPR